MMSHIYMRFVYFVHDISQVLLFGVHDISHYFWEKIIFAKYITIPLEVNPPKNIYHHISYYVNVNVDNEYNDNDRKR